MPTLKWYIYMVSVATKCGISVIYHSLPWYISYILQRGAFDLNHRCGICNSYTMGKSALPDIYAQARGPQAQGRVRIYRQSTSAHGIANMFYFST